MVAANTKRVSLNLKNTPPPPHILPRQVALWGEKDEKKWEHDNKDAKALSPAGDMPAAAEAAIRCEADLTFKCQNGARR